MQIPRRNIELKAIDPDPSASLEVCRALGAEDHGTIAQRDTYFEVARGGLKLREAVTVPISHVVSRSSRSNVRAMAVTERIAMADVPERDRYELSIDGEVVGFVTYRARSGLIAFVHTEVDEHCQGRGLADRLIQFALEDARTRGLAVLPFCPFVKAFIERHREFEKMVPETRREQFGL